MAPTGRRPQPQIPGPDLLYEDCLYWLQLFFLPFGANKLKSSCSPRPRPAPPLARRPEPTDRRVRLTGRLPARRAYSVEKGQSLQLGERGGQGGPKSKDSTFSDLPTLAADRMFIYDRLPNIVSLEPKLAGIRSYCQVKLKHLTISMLFSNFRQFLSQLTKLRINFFHKNLKTRI